MAEEKMFNIEESESNRFFRQSATLLAYLFITIGVLSFLVQLLFIYVGLSTYQSIPFLFISSTIVLFGRYLRKRIARIGAIGECGLELVSSKEKIQLAKEDIVSIAKLVRFSLSKRVWLLITFINGKGKKERWLFQTEPDIALTDRLKKMNIRLKNWP